MYTVGDDNQICFADLGAAELQFHSFPSATSVRLMLSVVPENANSIVIQYRQWKSQNVDSWSTGATVNSPSSGDYENVTGLTQGTEYEFRAVAYTGASGTGTKDETGNVLRLRIPKSVHIEDVVDAIIATLKANLAAAQDVVDAEYDDGIELADTPDASFYKRQLDPDQNWNFPVIQVYEAGDTGDANEVGNRSLFTHDVVIETWLASQDADTDEFKARLRRHNKAIRAVVKANRTWGGMAAWTDLMGHKIEMAHGESRTYAWASLKLRIQTYE